MNASETGVAGSKISIPPIVSVDDHVVEPAHIWDTRLPRRYRDVGPRIVRTGVSPVRYVDGQETWDPDPDGVPCDWWFYEDLRRPITRQYAAAGVDRDAVDAAGITYDDMRPGFYKGKARLADMDANGVEVSLCFPNVLPRFCGQTFLWARDRELAGLCVKAYNDWFVEEWLEPSGGRLQPAALIPLWDPVAAAAEVRRNAARGVRALSFCELPARLDLPSIHDRGRYWDPVFDACNETGTVVCMHIGSSSKIPTTSNDAPFAMTLMMLPMNAMASMSDWLFSDVFDRFPSLTLAYSEGSIGWIPFVLEKADRVFEEQRWMFGENTGRRRPSEYYADHVYGCYISDEAGLEALGRIGEDNVTFETDYPHTDGTWPNSREVAARQLAGLSQRQVDKIVRENALRMLGLTEGFACSTR